MNDEHKQEPKVKYEVLTCYHCGNETAMQLVSTYKYNGSEICDEDENGVPIYMVDWEDSWHLYNCPVCHDVTLKKKSWMSEEIDYAGRPVTYEEIIYPTITQKSKNMPVLVYRAFEAALKVRNLDGAICALSLRRTLEMMCKDLQATGRDLYTKLDSLSKKGILPPILETMAHVLKDLGNAAAHADDANFPKDVVRSMIDFTQTILDYVYVLPETIKEIQDKISLPKPMHSISDSSSIIQNITSAETS